MRTANLLAAFQLLCITTAFTPLPAPNYTIPGLPPYPPGPVAAYMVDNTNNTHGVAPDKGTLNGPVLGNNRTSSNNTVSGHNTTQHHMLRSPSSRFKRQSSSYWLANIDHGIMPNAPSGYKFYRNVMDYGAKGDGSTDDTAAINNAISDGNRCGLSCGSTSTLGALVFFPPGTYMVSTPIIQLYYTQFIGDPNNRPIIKGMANFIGIALIDTDVYIPGGNGDEWYVNQNQFYRQIRNFVIDLTLMPNINNDAGQNYVPTGIHWQVSQSTSLQNIHFEMPPATDANPDVTHVGIFTENGSGGFVSDLTFFGGHIGMRIGSQQFTASNLYFTSCGAAISMIWDWGFTWRNINVNACWIAINCTSFGGVDGQGTGSISVVDSTFNSVPYGITTHAQGPTPAIVLDNLLAINSGSIITVDGVGPSLTGPTSGSQVIASYAIGRRYTTIDDVGSYQSGPLTPVPSKNPILLNSNGTYFQRSKPQYENLGVGSFTSVTSQGVKNDGTGDQTSAINAVLAGAGNQIVFFPAGIYAVQGTIKVPVGTRMVGEGWPQIMATGTYFQDVANPKVLVQVGNPGDSGVIEISDLLFTVSGPTAGAILMEWNVAQSTQGSAAMWDSHFRVGGAVGSNLQFGQCPKGQGPVTQCIAASMLLHMTKTSSGYFENIWAWTADHDLDKPVVGSDVAAGQVSVYSARGILVESQGPTWLWATASEHNVFYQYQFLGAKNIIAGMMQTESPYYQPVPAGPLPFKPGAFPSDPTFRTCVTGTSCSDSWALRIINTTDVIVHGAGLYSFFNNYAQTCVPLENCQTRVIDTSYSQGIFMYNIFTKGVVEIISPEGGIPPVYQNDSNQSGYTSEVSAWLVLAETGADIGGDNGDAETVGTVTIKPLPCTSVPPSSTFTMSSECTSGILNLPTSGPDASSQNTPPGAPPVCNEVCDFERLLTGTCCGNGGSLGNPIEIPPGVTIPYDIILTSGYVPNVPITIGAPGSYDPNIVYGTATATTTRSSSSGTPIIIIVTSTYTSESTFVTTTSQGGTISSKTTTSPVVKTTVVTSTDGGGGGGGSNSKGCGLFPPGTPLSTFFAGIPLASAITLPAGLCNPLPTPIIIPPGPLPNGDPPCFPPQKCTPCFAGACGGINSNLPGGSGGGGGDPTDCSADPDPSTDTGLCGNGNFPVYDPITGEINCDYPASDAGSVITQCQAQADEQYDDSIQKIKCQQQVCGGAGGTQIGKRAPANPCPQPPSYQAGTGVCEHTFLCDTDLWPNVCNNARSAIDKKGVASVLTFVGDEVHDTLRYYGPHHFRGERNEGGPTDARRDNNEFNAAPGWGLVGCQVEEYPFGNSVTASTAGIANYNDRPTLRLIPQAENAQHGTQLGAFIKYIKAQNILNQKNPNDFQYCVSITGGIQPADYCINDQAQCRNKCAAAYGPAFILVNQILLKDRRAATAAGAADQRWDKWFDEQGTNRKFLHTLSWDAGKRPAQVPVTSTIPPQFCDNPSPGLKIYRGTFPNGQWVNSYQGPNGLVTVGTPTLRGPIQPNGKNLICDDVPASGSFPSKRDVETIEAEIERAIAIDSEILINNNVTVNVTAENATAWGMPLDPYFMQMDSMGMLSNKRMLSPRQVSGGSFLDPGVYTGVFECNYAGPADACDDCDGDDVDIEGGDDAPYTVTGTVNGPGTTDGGGSPTTTSGPTTPTPTRGLEIYSVLDTVNGGLPVPVEFWGELDYIVGSSSAWGCDQLQANTKPYPTNDKPSSTPTSWAFTKPIHGIAGCTYLNPTPTGFLAGGTLNCPGFDSPVNCEPVATPSSSCVDSGDDLNEYQAQAYCVF